MNKCKKMLMKMRRDIVDDDVGDIFTTGPIITGLSMVSVIKNVTDKVNVMNSLNPFSLL